MNYFNKVCKSHWIKKLLLLFLLWWSVVAVWGQTVQNRVMLPNGWQLTPAGKYLPLGDLPLNMALSPDGRWLAVTNNGYGRQSIKLIDVVHEKPCADVRFQVAGMDCAFRMTIRVCMHRQEMKTKLKSFPCQIRVTLH